MSWTLNGVLLNLTLNNKKVGDLSGFTENGVSFKNHACPVMSVRLWNFKGGGS